MKLNDTLSPQAKKALLRFDSRSFERIKKAIRKLQQNPFPHQSKSIKGSTEKLFRIRIGDHRVIYQVNSAESSLLVLKIDRRSRIYK